MTFLKAVKSKYLFLLALGIIVFLGFCIRIYKPTDSPAGFFCDEAAIGYNAYSILKTGADEYGIKFPFFFRSFGDYRNPLPIYLNLPSIALFGLSEYSVRLTSIFAGTLTLLFIFLLTKELFDFKVGLISSFLLAISPWHILYSRFGSEYIYFPLFFTLGFYIFVFSLKQKKCLPLAFFILGMGLYTYYPAWLVIPLFSLGLVFFYRNQILKMGVFSLLGIFVFFITLLPLIIGIKEGVALTRWNQVSVLKTFQSQKLGFSDSTKTMINTYLNHFSYKFLFQKGDIDYPGHFISRFSVRGIGELYLFQLPLIILGLMFLLINIKKPSSQALLLCLALYPAGSTLIGTDGGGPFAFRSIIGVIPFQIISALGLVKTITFIKNIKPSFSKIIPIIFITIFLIFAFSSTKNYLTLYYTQYPLYSSDFWGWQYGPREVMDFFLENKNKYEELFLMGNFNAPEIFIKFYDPKNLCQNRCQIEGIEKFNPKQKQLYAIGTDRLNEIPSWLTFSTIKYIYYPNNKPAFLIGELKLKGVSF